MKGKYLGIGGKKKKWEMVPHPPLHIPQWLQEKGNVNESSSKAKPQETLRKGMGISRSIALSSS